MSDPIHIVLLPGDGIGPEVVSAAVQVMTSVAKRKNVDIRFEERPFGGAAIDDAGNPLPDATLKACKSADAILLGAIGGPKWDKQPPDLRPESGLLRLRKELGAFANLRPVSVPAALASQSVLPADRVAGTDLVVVRELTGGIYFGEPRQYGSEESFDTMRYSATEIDRIARIAFDQAKMRGGDVTSVDKANVLASSRLWRERVTRLQVAEYPDVSLRHMYVDNAAMQLVRDPRSFDVLLTGNLFGDILSDLASTLSGSLGLLPSASLGGDTPLFEPVHGSAPDIASQGKANPVAAMLSGAMLFDELQLSELANDIRQAIDQTLKKGISTSDLSDPGVSTSYFTDHVLKALDAFTELHPSF
ncbi:MAG: 3-isopropylmalate dehydrogenase [Bacteroidetes bacterium]|nr:3-isopropylmalate dehydrogenase [Bacteroidota bacterium]MDA1333486.1 3-isopropylmalate dehydrogenase [Bacteroidota bacterium]